MNIKSILAGVAVMWMAAGCASESLGPAADTSAPDRALAVAVREKLQADPDTGRSVIGVSARGGVVTLNGIVPNLTVRSKALGLASGVRGVQGVQDQMRAGY